LDMAADDCQRARANCIAHLLSVVPYEPRKIPKPKWTPRAKPGDYKRPPLDRYRFVLTRPPPSADPGLPQ
jgi:polyphosphate kinase